MDFKTIRDRFIIIVVIGAFIAMTIQAFMPQRTICVQTFNTTPIAIEKLNQSQLGIASDFLHRCMTDCAQISSGNIERSACIKMCFDKIQIRSQIDWHLNWSDRNNSRCWNQTLIDRGEFCGGGTRFA